MGKNLDNHKGIIVIAIIYVNAVSFLGDASDLNIILKYFYSLSSYGLPLLFMISAYNYGKTHDHFSHFTKTFLKYSKYLIITVIINLIIFDIDFSVYEAFFLSKDAVGYFWFIKTLLIFQLFILASYLFNDGLLIVFASLLLVASTQGEIGSVVYFIYFIFGFFYSRINTHFSDLIPKNLKYIVLLAPFALKFLYYPVSPFVFVTTFLLFNGIIHTKREVHTILEFYGRNSLESIFFQYFAVEFIAHYIDPYNPLIDFVVLVIITTGCVYVYEKIYTYIRNKYFPNFMRLD